MICLLFVQYHASPSMIFFIFDEILFYKFPHSDCPVSSVLGDAMWDISHDTGWFYRASPFLLRYQLCFVICSFDGTTLLMQFSFTDFPIQIVLLVMFCDICCFDGTFSHDTVLLYRFSPSDCTVSSVFLAHLSRRLMGELIVYQSLRRPSVRRLSSVRQHFQTSSPLKPLG